MRLFSQLAILTTLGCGLFTGYVALVPLQAVMRVQPTTAAWDASACPAGTYTVRGLAVDGAGQSFLSDPVTVTLPAASVPVSWSNLAPGSYTAKATASNSTGLIWESASQPVTGMGIAPTPTTTPTPTVTPTPTSTPPIPPTPTPTQTPTPVPGVESADCTKMVMSPITLTSLPITDTGLHKWEISSTWLLRDGTYALQPGNLKGANATAIKYVAKDMYAQDSRDGLWYKLNGAVKDQPGVLVTTEPVCGAAPTPTPTVTPTSTPTSTPAPMDFSLVVDAIKQAATENKAAVQQSTIDIKAAIVTAIAPPAPRLTVLGTVTLVEKYTNGDWHIALTNGTWTINLRIPAADLPTAPAKGTLWSYIK